jgi:diguanylate cyclase (GGDEF)-like protein
MLAPSDTGSLVRLAQARSEVQRLYDLTRDVGNSLSLSETLSVAGMRLQELIPHDCIAIYVRDREHLKPIFVQGENARLFGSRELRLDSGACGRAAQSGEPAFNADPAADFGDTGDEELATRLRSSLIVPLTGEDGFNGVLALHRIEAGAFTPEHLRLLTAVRLKLSHAIENAWNFQRVEQSTTLDALTSLPNAKSLFLQLDRELARCRRSNQTLLVLVCELTGLASINERFGRLRGNTVVQEVARQITESCREYDFVARMGGAEFIVVLPEFPAPGVDRKVALLRHLGRQAGERICGEGFLNVHVGQASFPDDGSDAEELLACAEGRMRSSRSGPKLATRLSLHRD